MRCAVPGGRTELPVRGRPARALHPVAWWIWSVGPATAAGRTVNPLLLVLVLAVLGLVVSARRTEAPWAGAYRSYLVLALVVIGIRVVFRAVFGGGAPAGAHILFALPRVPLPDWYAGVRIGGPVALEAVVAAAVDGLRLACLLCCLGAVNTLADPKHALQSLPGALHELGVAVTVALTTAPQLAHSAQRVRRATRLRGGRRSRRRGLSTIVVPVLHDAFERSLHLAASMDSRGYGRARVVPETRRRVTSALLLSGPVALCVGAYGLLDTTVPPATGLAGFAVGTVSCGAGLALAGGRVRRTRYRPDPWLTPEWIVAGAGFVGALALVMGTGFDPTAQAAGADTLRWPELPPVPVGIVLSMGLAAFAAPPPPAGVPGSDPE
ncbi:MAG: energy-coupling factor transport system permease protein [Actinomycetota bacterium]|nr:energy-coupling factor transport system permease protein [Actinomycetota bacterium]